MSLTPAEQTILDQMNKARLSNKERQQKFRDKMKDNGIYKQERNEYQR